MIVQMLIAKMALVAQTLLNLHRVRLAGHQNARSGRRGDPLDHDGHLGHNYLSVHRQEVELFRQSNQKQSMY